MPSAFSDSLKGHFLLAMPGMADPNFSQTVTCICEHSDEGAMGIVVNRRHDLLSAGEIFDELGIRPTVPADAIPVHCGGPVHPGEIFILHGPPFGWEGCLKVTATLALSTTRDILEAIAAGRGPAAFLINLGCAGWGPGQLEMEIRENAWLTHPVFDENIFVLPVAERWEAGMRRIGISPTRLSDTAGHA
ncbi:MAG: YqgE/AlgH family protein [Desulfobacterales bacterium]|nr:YqgE/AlgH family protein [Desulfobacterales bacterium]